MKNIDDLDTDIIAKTKLLFSPPSIRDAVEDLEHENGWYMNVCHKCDNVFNGYKRRFLCMDCEAKAAYGWDRLTEVYILDRKVKIQNMFDRYVLSKNKLDELRKLSKL
jgi:hypothetical protein